MALGICFLGPQIKAHFFFSWKIHFEKKANAKKLLNCECTKFRNNFDYHQYFHLKSGLPSIFPPNFQPTNLFSLLFLLCLFFKQSKERRLYQTRNVSRVLSQFEFSTPTMKKIFLPSKGLENKTKLLSFFELSADKALLDFPTSPTKVATFY